MAIIHLTYVLCCKPTILPHHIQVDTIRRIGCTDTEHMAQPILCTVSIVNCTFNIYQFLKSRRRIANCRSHSHRAVVAHSIAIARDKKLHSGVRVR